ncbi:hypothetical protein PVAND_007798 [Polypedilum vanderplanki]|uniref:Vitamin K-dependent gamma-carboxylase n=1 Tax=Polypedilum vanderplanki TaxID=319348 RepID=A0A9J6C8A3_POLVA|nr:hypothetical protein PVAND_007798 [Polypedilum vanderplanki]
MKQRHGKIAERISTIFNYFTGHDISNFTSYNKFTSLMFTSVDGSSLGICRMLFGIMMLLDITEERGGSDLDLRWGEIKDCRFPLFSFIKAFSLAKMGLIYFLMWLGCIGIILGYKFKSSCLAFVITYWYIFLLDKSSWNNHSYLYGLVAFIFLFTDAHHFCSIDSWSYKLNSTSVPFWNYFLLKFQFFILYFIAGLKKFSFEWLNGYSMTNLSHHWIFSPFRLLLGAELTNLFIIHWFATLFDTSIVFFLIYKKSRRIATFFAIAFHLMNSRLFNIGMFPFVCVVQLPLFYEHNWPRTLWRKLKCSSCRPTDERNEKRVVLERTLSFSNDTKKMEEVEFRSKKRCTLKEKFTTLLILIYCCLQLLLPYSHSLTKGYSNWRHLYGYSWDMMMSEWSTMLVSVRIVDNGNNKQHFMEPLAFSDSYRWTQYPDMTYQYAQCINQNLIRDFYENPNTLLSSDNFSIYFDIWSSLNGRFQQRVYNPTVDLVRSEWHPFVEPSFILPLLSDLTHLKREIEEISREVYSWSNSSDLLFIADFPGLSLDNYIPPIMDNVTLTVLSGIVKFEQENDTSTITLSQGQSIHVKSGVFHKVTTVSDTPSYFLYTYINSTHQFNDVQNSAESQKHEMQTKAIFSTLAQELRARYENYKKFFYHVANSFLFEFYSVPMPRRLREFHDM